MADIDPDVILKKVRELLVKEGAESFVLAVKFPNVKTRKEKNVGILAGGRVDHCVVLVSQLPEAIEKMLGLQGSGPDDKVTKH